MPCFIANKAFTVLLQLAYNTYPRIVSTRQGKSNELFGEIEYELTFPIYTLKQHTFLVLYINSSGYKFSYSNLTLSAGVRFQYAMNMHPLCSQCALSMHLVLRQNKAHNPYNHPTTQRPNSV